MAKLLTKREAIERAIEAGASLEDIEREASHQRRHVGSVPFNHMIRALNMMTWHNDVGDWTRLAGAMIARTSRA